MEKKLAIKEEDLMISDVKNYVNSELSKTDLNLIKLKCSERI